MRLSTVLLTLSIFLSTAYGFNNHRTAPTITELPNTQLFVHRVPNINLSVTNFGNLGSLEGEYEDAEGIFDPAPGAMFPAESDLEYLFIGAIWIGAEIDTVDQNGNPALDTVVSVGLDGWWGNHFELYPEDYPNGGLWREEMMADEEIYAVYYDTNSSIGPDPFTQRPHIPMHIKITQHSFAWSSPGYNDFVILEYILENIGSRYLHNTYVGIYWDGDVFHYSEGNPGYMDDICGYVEHGDHGISWLADNDGQPQNGQFDSLSPVGVIGLTLVGSNTPDLEASFNWWVNNINSVYDWGPRRIENYNGPFPCGGNGTPCGDIVKYEMMSNGEKDYGTIWCDLSYWENNGWIPKPSFSPNLADGFETKYLISFGPFDLPAGEVETLTVAVIGGNQIHSDPDNYVNNLLGHTADSSSIAQYYNNLGFAQFLELADSVVSFYQHDYVNVPLGPPSNFRVTAWDEDFVSLGWQALNRSGLHEYRIYRGTESGVYDPRKLTPDGFTDTVFVDTAVQNNITYYYVIMSAKISGLEGGYSREASINTGQPQTPTGLTAAGGNSIIDLSWNHNPEDDILGYLIYKALGPDNFMLIDTIETNYFTDTYVGNGLEFFYYVTAIDSFMNVSFGSDTVSATPMGFDSGILLINCTSVNPQVNPDFDSMMAFYENILANYRHQAIYYSPQMLPEIANYSTLIYAKELASGYQRFYNSRNILETYLELGGNIILAGTRQLTPHSGVEGVLSFDSDEIQNQFFNLNGAEFPSAYENMEFTGGNSISTSFYNFALDSSRTGRIIYPSGLPPGRLNGIGALIPNDSSEVIYTYVAINPDTSNYHGRPIGIVHQTDNYNTAVLEFPLYYVEEPISHYILHQILNDFGEVPSTDIDDVQEFLPKSTHLLQNYPNPFNNTTTLKYNLALQGIISITIYNILGQEVAQPVNEYQQAGARTVTWNADNLPSGIYFARMKTEDYSG
ncbi:MAG: T9SS type A sorting domain-containing protein, partial [Candidatus Zixiibacteriota bacterium]